MANKELALVADTTYPVLDPGAASDVSEIIEENLGESLNPGDLDRIGIPPGGGTSWEIPTLDGLESSKELRGVIVAVRKPRTYWETSIDDGEDSSPPNCSSDDGVLGFGDYGVGSDLNPSGQCKNCPMDQWGSGLTIEDKAKRKDGGRRGPKACREQRQLFMLLPGSMLPTSVTLPPSSIRPVRQYLMRLVNAQQMYYTVETVLTLEAKNEGGRRWSVVDAKRGDSLSPDQVSAVRSYSESIKGALDSSRFDSDDALA